MGVRATVPAGCFGVLARRFGRRMTRAQALLWDELKGRRLRGYRFERWHPVDRYVIDFYCSELRLAVDVAGGEAFQRGSFDEQEKRIRFQLCGVTCLVFAEEEILHNLDGVVSRIRQTIRYLPWK